MKFISEFNKNEFEKAVEKLMDHKNFDGNAKLCMSEDTKDLIASLYGYFNNTPHEFSMTERSDLIGKFDGIQVTINDELCFGEVCGVVQVF